MGAHHPRELGDVEFDRPEGGAGLFGQGLGLLKGIGVMDAEMKGASAGGALLQKREETLLGAPADAPFISASITPMPLRRPKP